MEYHDEQWKGELAMLESEIASISSCDDAPDLFLAERPIFYSAFIVRKLIEDTAVTDALKSRSLDVTSIPSSRGGEELFYEFMFGPVSVADHFEFGNATNARISFEDLASEIIHSDGFVWHSERPHAFLVFSYRNFLKRALHVELETYLSMIRDVLRDRARHFWISKDLSTGKITRHAGAKIPKGESVVARNEKAVAEMQKAVSELKKS